MNPETTADGNSTLIKSTSKAASGDKLIDKRIINQSEALSPMELRAKIEIGPELESFLIRKRKEVESAVEGRDRRPVLMVGPCSIHDTEEGLEYARRLKKIEEKVSSRLIILMRTYFEKPRTIVGWKGLIVQPNVFASQDDPQDMERGLRLARKFLREVTTIGLGTITEFLDPLVPQYIGELITTGTIGARTTESQTHRMMASGLSMPIGFKNGTDGTLDAGLNALCAAHEPHTFMGINEFGRVCLMQTTGNIHGYVVLRGGKNSTNFDSASVDDALLRISKQGIQSPVVVDCSHGNSKKSHRNQAHAFRTVLDQLAERKAGLMGAMLESNLQPGRQNVEQGKALLSGVSITDECIGFEETEELILEAFDRVG